MRRHDLNFEYPENLVATEKKHPPRVMWVAGAGQAPIEIDFADVLTRLPAGDVLVINDTRVVKRRVFALEGQEILFLKRVPGATPFEDWQVLFPAKNLKIGAQIHLPMQVTATLIEKGRPQTLRLSRPLTDLDFVEFGELPLPPYIQKARHERHNLAQDQDWYQTAWAEKDGSLASPTASLHFQAADLLTLKSRGVAVHHLTLHVGLGTFLPVTAEDLNDHIMHAEVVEIPAETWQAVMKAKAEGRGVWALGTTVARSLESAARGLLVESVAGFKGESRLFMKPGEEWRVVNRLMTNFHQPESTLLALVASFHSLESVKLCYQWAIQKQFRLFSYGDFSVWIK